VPQNWISFRLDPALHERLKAAAAAERRSMANWLATVVEKALNDAERDSS
jgi:predicted HicB family RNase H-like nuclease